MEKSSYKLSRTEYDCLRIKERYSAFEVVKKMKLPSTTNAIDHIDLELTPYLVPIIEMFGQGKYAWLFSIAPTQSGKTLLIQIFFADRMDQEDGTMLFILADKNTGGDVFNEKMVDMVRVNDFLLEKVLLPHKDNLSMSGIKMYNCKLLPGYSGSPASMNSLTCKAGGVDEIRLHKLKVKRETNSIEYLADRTSSYTSTGRTQHIGVTTPANEGDLMHAQTLKEATSIVWWMHPCPECGRVQILDIYTNFDLLPDGVNYTSTCRCKFCKKGIFSDAGRKKELNATGVYAEESMEGYLKSSLPVFRKDTHTIFRWTSESSPFRTFDEIARKYNAVKDDPNALNNFNQAWRARFTSKKKSSTSVKALSTRISPTIRQGIVPSWTKFITAGCDTQGNGFPYWVHAYGSEGKSACIDTGLLTSDYLTDTSDDVSKKFEKQFERKIYLTAKGEPWAIALWGIDTGGNRTQVVYDAVSGFRKCVPCKGDHNGDVSIRFAKKPGTDILYLVKTENYFERTDIICFDETWFLYNNIDRAVLREYSNLKQVIEDKQNRYGEQVNSWKKFGKCDWRIAYAHCEICLDVLFENGIRLRNELNNPDFSYNPIHSVMLLNMIDASEDEENSKPAPPVTKSVLSEPNIHDIPSKPVSRISNMDNPRNMQNSWNSNNFTSQGIVM